MSLTICSLLSVFLFFLLSRLLSFSNNLHSPCSLIAKQPAPVRDRERLEERIRDAQLDSSSVMSLTIYSLLSFFLFFLLSPLLSFSNILHSPCSLIAKQPAPVSDRERLEERSRDAVSACNFLFHVSSNLFSSFLLFFLSSFPPSYVL